MTSLTSTGPIRPKPTTVSQVRGTSPRACDDVAQQLRRLILSGGIDRDGFLEPTTDLLQRFEVSRPVLREALRVLENEGLVRVRQGSRRGVQVLSPSTISASRIAAHTLQALEATVGDLYEALMGFEPFAARLLAERHSRNDIAALRKAEAALKRTLKGPSSGDHGIQLARFHYLIVELTGNMVMTLFADTVSNALERHQANEVEARYDLAAADSDRATFRERGTRSISKLVRLIEAGDAEGTEGHWRRHLRNSNEFWLRGQDPHAPINVLS